MKQEINLNKCKVGDTVFDRNGMKGVYFGKTCDVDFPHKILWPTVDSYTNHTDNGSFYTGSKDEYDIVEVIRKMEPKTKNIFDKIPDGVTEFTYQGKQYKKRVVEEWIEVK